MNLNTPLIIPIDLQALCVGYPDVTAQAYVLPPQADFSVLPSNEGGTYVSDCYTSSSVLAEASPFNGQVAAQFGIHLHWALPDGLTQSIPPASDPTAQPQFPPVPNRWMLTRIIQDLSDPTAPATSLQSWVIESDRLSLTRDNSLPTAFPQPTVPNDPTSGGQTYNYVGQAFSVETWAESTVPQRLAPLVATGYGQAAFAAYYPNSSTVFGFLDNFEGVTYNADTSTVHYQVTGWYSDAANDPQNGESYTEAQNPFGWAYTAGSNPQSTVCNGIITNIPWNPNTQYLDATANALSVAIGNNAPETFSALLANVNNNKSTYPYAELLLNLLQFNYLSKPGLVPDSLQGFEETLHKAAFGPMPSGASWRILTDDPADKSLYKQIPSFLGALANLNKLQAAADAQLLLMNTQSVQLFSDWYKYLVLAHDVPEGIPTGLNATNAQTFVTTEASALSTLQANYQANFLSPVQQAQTALAASLPTTLRLEQNDPRGHYWAANNPVLILSGDDVTPATRYGMDGTGSPGGLLPCRLQNELLTGLSLDAGFVTNSAAITLDCTQLPLLDASPADAPVTLINTLLQEAFLLCPALQNTIAAILAQQGGSNNPATLDFSGTVQALQTALTALMAGQATPNATYTGTAPDAMMIFNYAGTPWLPIIMQYSVFYQPVFSVDTAGAAPVPYPATFINDQFSWNKDAIELQYTGAGLQSGATYTGTVNLTPGASQDLSFAIQHYLDNVPANADTKELQALLTQVQQLPQLAQGLGGFIESLLMSEQVLQLPVWDPLADTLLISHFVEPVAQAVNGQNYVAPLPTVQFNPVRSGSLRINEIRLIDAFGQFKDYQNPTVYVAQTLLPPETLAATGVQAFLPPRISQPAKLDISWIPVANEQDDSPIIGWVLPNRLDNSIYLYDTVGNAIGELVQPSGTSNVVFMTAAGAANPPGTTLSAALTGLNPQLVNVVNTLYNAGESSYLAPFIAAVNQALSMIFPPVSSDDQANALLIGQPLVLANISMQLELLGAPAIDQSWNGFATAAVNNLPRTDGGLSGVQFPVQLGDLLQLNDGLVGFWPFGTSGTADLSTFYSLGTTATTGPVIAPLQDTIVLTPSPAASPLDFLLLLDPLAPVHATTGILPVHTFRLDPELYATALDNLKITFLTAPILSGTNDGTVAMPIPDETQGTWNWITVQAQQWNTMTLEQESTQQATLNYTPQQILEGWLQLSNFEPKKK
jgi:hypothetical protein